jgi:hypothetical protein
MNLRIDTCSGPWTHQSIPRCHGTALVDDGARVQHRLSSRSPVGWRIVHVLQKRWEINL